MSESALQYRTELIQTIEAEPATFIAESARAQSVGSALMASSLVLSTATLVLAWLRVFGGYRSNGYVLAALLVAAAVAILATDRQMLRMYELGTSMRSPRPVLREGAALGSAAMGFVVVGFGEELSYATWFFAAMSVIQVVGLLFDVERFWLLRHNHAVARILARQEINRRSTAVQT